MSDHLSPAKRVDRVLSLAAGIAAVTAVAVSLYQASLAREQLRASAWPYLGQSNSFTPGQRYLSPHGRERGSRAGTGARVHGARRRPTEPALVYSSFGRGTVLPPGG